MSVTVTSDVVEVARIVSSTITALAWPAMILAVVILLRPLIPSLFARATNIEWGSLRVDFAKGLDAAETAAEQIEPAEALEDGTVEQPEPRNEVAPVASTPLPPRLAVLDAFMRVELELLHAAARLGISITRGQSPLFLTRVLKSRGAISDSTVALLDQLRDLRNRAAHGWSGEEISESDADRYVGLAEVAVSALLKV